MRWLDNSRVVIGIKNIITDFGIRVFKLIVIVDGMRILPDIWTGDETSEWWLGEQLAYREQFIRNILSKKDD